MIQPPKLDGAPWEKTRPPFDGEEDFHSLVGKLVFILKDTEMVIKTCEKVIFGRQPLESVFSHDKRPLGALLTDLKKVAALDSTFESMLVRVIDLRNRLLHDRPDGLMFPDCPEKLEAGYQFVFELMECLMPVKFSFSSLLVNFAKENGIPDEDLAGYAEPGYLDAIAAHSNYSQIVLKARPQ